MADWTDGIQRNYCDEVQRLCAYCGSLGQCELSGYCPYKKSLYATAATPNEMVYIKAKKEFNQEKEKQEDANGCGYCNGEGVISFVYHPSLTDTGIQAPALYCPMCGRRIIKEEWE